MMIVSTKTVHEDDIKNNPGKEDKTHCEHCGSPETDFTITPVQDTGTTYIKDTYYLCRSCFEILILTDCQECGSTNIIFDFIHLERYCYDCGTVVGSLKNKSHKEKKDYDAAEPDYLFATSDIEV